MRLLFIQRLKYYFKSFCMKIWARWLYIHLSVVFPSRMPAGLQIFATQPILLSENIPNIWHNHHKHKEVRPDWNDKNDNAKLRALVSYGRFYQWLRLLFLKEIFDQVRKDLDCELFYSELNVTTSHIIFTIPVIDNIHIVLENDNTVLIKGFWKGCKC